MTHPDEAARSSATPTTTSIARSRWSASSATASVTYAIFMRRPVVFAPRLALEWLEETGRARNATVELDLRYREGKWVGAGEPMMYITGSFFHLVDLETIFLQKLGPACVAAYNAWTMCADLPKSAFLAMDARHCAGPEMAEMMAYAASVGSARAKRKVGAIGFIGNATDATAHFFGRESGGSGTMPHALIGYAGSTLRAAEMFHETFPDEAHDRAGRLLRPRDLRRAGGLPALSRAGRRRASCRLRLDTTGGRYIEGLDPSRRPTRCWSASSPESIRGYRSEAELRYLVGTGVSAAAILHHARASSTAPASPKVKIVASSGFRPGQVPDHGRGQGAGRRRRHRLVSCRRSWTETYATADIVEYDGRPAVKVGREFLLRKK